MNHVLPTVVGLFVLVVDAASLALVVWGFYLMYLATRALQKYLRS
ncbi:MAG TPA: hypothetical protein VGX22_07260 [Candidatus Dormibacteraeota bacterium]|nr:hypothetical protein [Candidatus Dormibacteraeota bacterium]